MKKKVDLLLRIVYIPALKYRSVARGSVISGAGSITAWPAQASDRAKSGRNKTVSVTTCLDLRITIFDCRFGTVAEWNSPRAFNLKSKVENEKAQYPVV